MKVRPEAVTAKKRRPGRWRRRGTRIRRSAKSLPLFLRPIDLWNSRGKPMFRPPRRWPRPAHPSKGDATQYAPQLADKDPKTIAIILEDLVLTTSSTDAFSSIKENQLSIVDFDQIKWIYLVLNLFAFCSHRTSTNKLIPKYRDLVRWNNQPIQPAASILTTTHSGEPRSMPRNLPA